MEKLWNINLCEKLTAIHKIFYFSLIMIGLHLYIHYIVSLASSVIFPPADMVSVGCLLVCV